MKKNLLIVSATLIGISIILFLYINISIKLNIKNNKKVIDYINNIITKTYVNYEENDFSSLEINNKDYKGIINIPSIDTTIPVESFCKFSIQSACYNPFDNLSIITTNLSDSTDLYKKLEIGDEITFTSMLGDSYKFNIEKIKKVKKLSDIDSSYNMNLIIKNYFEVSYTICYAN